MGSDSLKVFKNSKMKIAIVSMNSKRWISVPTLFCSTRDFDADYVNVKTMNYKY